MYNYFVKIKERVGYMFSKRNIFLSFVFFSLAVVHFADARTSRVASNLQSSGSAQASSTDVSADVENSLSVSECMDSVCIYSKFPEKGRCRCSDEIASSLDLELKLFDIENEIEKRNRVSVITSGATFEDISVISSKLQSLYENMSAIDTEKLYMTRMAVMSEGQEVLDDALQKCDIKMNSQDFIDYKKQIDDDCSVYLRTLRDRVEMATSTLSVAVKNQRQAEKNNFMKNNLLSEDECYLEYEACLKEQCGKGFSSCLRPIEKDGAVIKCKAIMKNKCEAYEDGVIKKLRDLMRLAR